MEANSTSRDQGHNYSNITFGYTVGYYGDSNITDGSYNFGNGSFNYPDYSDYFSDEYQYYQNLSLALYVMTWLIICISLPLILLAICFLYSEMRNDHVAPIYVINLLISDLIQLCCLIVRVAPRVDLIIFIISDYVYYYCLAASVGFMVCIALERYLVIACPVWYHFRRTIKVSVLVCVVVWVIALFDFFTFWFCKNYMAAIIIWSIFFLLPLPLLMFFLGGTIKALSASKVPSDEKRRILGVLVLVLFIYTLLFVPRIISFLTDSYSYMFLVLSNILVMCSPLADLVLYIFIRKGTTDKLLAFVCCCRTDSDDVSISTA